MRNTFICNPFIGIAEPGEDYGCIMGGFAFGAFRSIDDTCVLTRTDSGPYDHKHLFMLVDQNYPDTVPRMAELINPTFIVNLPAAHFAGDSIAYLLMDAPYLTFSISNPRYREIAMGPGWGPSDRHFAIIDGARAWPPNGSNTFVRWDNVVEAPGDDIALIGGATAASIDAAPMARVLPEHFGDRIKITGATLVPTCRPGELRYETGGATKEICVCDPADTWKCFPLGALQD